MKILEGNSLFYYHIDKFDYDFVEIRRRNLLNSLINFFWYF